MENLSIQDIVNIFDNDNYEQVMTDLIVRNHRTIYYRLLNENNLEDSENENSDRDSDNEDSDNRDSENENSVDEESENEESEDEIDLNNVLTQMMNRIPLENINLRDNNFFDNIESNISNTPLSIEGSQKIKTYRVWTTHPGQCSICLENFKWLDKVSELPCKHYFHESCIDTWFNTNCTCPICRYKLNSNGDIDVNRIQTIYRGARLFLGIVERLGRHYIN